MNIWFLFSKIVVQIINRITSQVDRGPFFESTQFSWAAAVETAYPDIKKELETLLDTRGNIASMSALSGGGSSIVDSDSWKSFFLLVYGTKVEAHVAQCPKSYSAIRNIPGVQTAFFSIFPANTRLEPHKGPYNGVLRYHLPIVLPDDRLKCGISVDGETRHWEYGKSMIFDDSHVHHAWNDSNEMRVVLFVDFLRPQSSFGTVLNTRFYRWIRGQKFNRKFLDNVLESSQETK